MDIEWIRVQVRLGGYLVSLHGDEERRNEGLEIADIEAALLAGRILEDYPADPRGHSCLVCGESGGTPIHCVCGRNRAGKLVIITTYVPRMPKWMSPTERNRS